MHKSAVCFSECFQLADISAVVLYRREYNLEKFIIKGGRRLHGEVEISGAKNAAVAIIPAVILSDEPCILENVPNISDVSISLRILYEMGADVDFLTKNTVRIDAARIAEPIVPYEMAKH